ncbi:uncharacterized protein LOC124267543 [Haliotis rubra]|uniref:uncharacterized protein LOC124267543 n=1 Tax=Haliotis rubra TaxID=36100 RepID=UPI001EE58448|nr:uncharacterized protein LOC124267543 [Haliotis rubra]
MDRTHTDMNPLPQVMFNDQLCPVDVRTNSVIVPMRIPLESISLPSRQQPTVSPRYVSDNPVYQLPWSKKPQQACKDRKKKNEVNPFRLFEPSQPTRPRNTRISRKSTRISQTISPGIHVASPMGMLKHLHLADPPASVPPTVATSINNPVQTALPPRRGFRRLKPYQKSDPFTIHKLSSNQQIISHQGQLVVSPNRIFNQIPHTRPTVPTFVPVNQQGAAIQFFEGRNKASTYHPIQTHQEKAVEFENRNVFSVKSGYGSDTCGFERNFLPVKVQPYYHGISPGEDALVLPLTPQQPTEGTTISQQWKAPPVYPSSGWERMAPSIYPSERERMAPPIYPTPACPPTEGESVAPCIYPFTKWECAAPPGCSANDWKQLVPSVYLPDEYKPVALTCSSAEWGGFSVSDATHRTTTEHMCVQDQLIDVITEVRKDTLASSSDCSRPVPCPIEQLSRDLDLAEATSMALIVVTMGNGSFIADDMFPDEYRSVICELDSIVEESRLMEAFSVDEHDVNENDVVVVHDDTESPSESSIDSDVDVDSDNRSDTCSTSRPWPRNVAGSLRWVKGQQHDPVAFGRKCYMGTRGDLNVPLTSVDHTVDYILGLDCPLPQFVET